MQQAVQSSIIGADTSNRGTADIIYADRPMQTAKGDSFSSVCHRTTNSEKQRRGDAFILSWLF